MDTKFAQSSDQGHTAQSSDQGNLQSTDQVQQSVGYKVGARTYNSIEELGDAYKALEAEYTKKTQQLKSTSDQSSDDLDVQLDQMADLLAPKLKARGYVMEDDIKLQSIFALNPDLRDKEQEIKDLANLPHNKGVAYEDIIAKYGLKSSDKLAKAKSSTQPMGISSKEQPQVRSIRELDPTGQEYEEWRKANLRRP